MQAREATKTSGVRSIIDCRLDLDDGMVLLVYPTVRLAYSRLCRLLSAGQKCGGKAKCILDWSDVLDRPEGLIAVLIPKISDDLCALWLRKLRDAFEDRAYMPLTLRRRPNDQMRIYELNVLAHRMSVATIVTNNAA